MVNKLDWLTIAYFAVALGILFSRSTCGCY